MRPSSDVYTSKDSTAGGGYDTCAQFSYQRPGLVPPPSRDHFEVALRLARPHVGRGPAMDFMCANGVLNGVLVLSLAKFFPPGTAHDTGEEALRPARALVDALELQHVRVVINRGMSLAEMRDAAGAPARVLFPLETLEHAGDPARLYPSKIEFVEGLSSLLEDDGVIVVSVPTMVGVPLLLRYWVQSALRLSHERQSSVRILRSGFLKDTEALEPHREWQAQRLQQREARPPPRRGLRDRGAARHDHQRVLTGAPPRRLSAPAFRARAVREAS